MVRVPMPREVRPAFGPFLEAVPLLFRWEVLSGIAVLTALPILAAAVPPGATGPWAKFYLPRVGALDALPAVLEFVRWLVVAGVALLLLPVARGDHGLSWNPLGLRFGSLAMAGAAAFGASIALDLVLRHPAGPGAVPLPGFDRFLRCGLDAGAAAGCAWLLAVVTGPREVRPPVPRRLLLWPGLLAATLVGGALCALIDERSLRLLRSPVLAGRQPGMALVISFAWSAAVVFTILWMLRAIDNEAEAEPRG